MTALTASRTALLFISGDPCRRLPFQFSRRSQEVALLTRFPVLRRSGGIPNGRKGRRQGRRGGVRLEEELNGSHDLESEIYEFMERSANRMDFPSRDELIAAGREDLARAIAKEGGWLAYGWDLDEEEEEETVSNVSDLVGKRPCEECSGIFQRRRTLVSGEAHVSSKTDLDSLWASSEGSSGPSTSGRPM